MELFDVSLESVSKQVQNGVTRMRSMTLGLGVGYDKVLSWIQSQREAELDSDGKHKDETQIAPVQSQEWLMT